MLSLSELLFFFLFSDTQKCEYRFRFYAIFYDRHIFDQKNNDNY